MRISDLVRIKPPGEPVSLSRLAEIRDSLDREGGNLSLMSAANVGEILEEYVTPLDPAADPLYRFIKTVSVNGGRGAGFLVRGPRSSGKTHLLAVADLLLEYPRVRPIFSQTHEGYEAALRGLTKLDPVLVVPVPLEEHRAADEHLEDIIFDRTEQELRRARHGLSLPLSEHSYALDLIERHVAPRYGAELDAHVARMPGTQRSWRDLVERNPAAAVAAARAFAQEIGYPLDFRQSRVERLARLLDIITNRDFNAIIWLIDDLGQFLAATGQKAVRNDAAFLEFLGQRSKIAPLYILATMNMAPDQASAIEPYMLANISDNYETISLSAGEMRRVGLTRALAVPDEGALTEATDEVHAAYVQAFGQVEFSREELRASYPMHPLAMLCLETIYTRFLAEADGPADFLQSLAGHGSAGAALDRDYWRLLSLGEALDHLAARLSAHPQAAPYLQEALDYYEKNGAQLYPAAPDLPAKLARQLIVLRLANMSVPVSRLVELLGLNESKQPLAGAAQVREALEAMRLRGRFVDVRRGATPETDAYHIDVEANLTELARRQLLAFKSSLADDDPRLGEAATAAASGTALPLADLAEPRTLEVEWGNTTRCLLVQAQSLAGLSAERLASRSADLSDAMIAEDARLFLAEIIRPAEQRAVWREAAQGLPRSRWAWGVMAWLPRELSAEELDRVKEFAACRAILGASGSRYDPKVGDRLVEEASRLANEVRSVVEAAYAEGEVLSGEGALLGPNELGRVRGDWTATLRAIAAASLAKVYPQASAPGELLASRDAVDELLRLILGPTGRQWEDEDRPAELAQAFLAPLKLAGRLEDKWRLDVEASEVAAEVMERVRRRDQTPETEPGRPVACRDLAQFMLKSPFGLPPELFELVIAALIRTGYLVPLDEERRPLQPRFVSIPLSEGVAYVARSPLLGTSDWHDLTRVCRVLLERMVPRADHPLQTELWEALCDAKNDRLQELARLRKIVEALRVRLEQPTVVWSGIFECFDQLQSLYEALDPELLPAEGLQHFLAKVRPLLEGTPMGLSLLLRQLSLLDTFLERTAPDVVVIYDYLRSEELAALDDPDLQTRRGQLLMLIGQGEKLIAEELNFRRQVQILLSVYKRRYIAWHTRCYRMSIFDKYRSLRTSPELRALAHLQQLELKLPHEGPHAVELVEAQEARRCNYAGLAEALDRAPTCPECSLRLDEDVDLTPLEDIRAAAEREIGVYVERLRRPDFQAALREYTLALPSRGELVTKLEQLLSLSEAPPARTLLSILSDDVIIHLNRVLSGKTVRPRDFGQLRSALAGRTLSKEEAQRLFEKWLGGDEGEEDEVIHVEP